MIDEQERFRGFVNRQYVKLKRVASVGSLLLLAVNLAFTVYPYVSHHMLFSNIYVGVFLLFLLILLFMWILAHIYVVKMEMYRTESKADMVYNPYAVYAFVPRDEAFLKYFYLPTLEGIYDSLADKSSKEKLKVSIDKVRFWVENGFIPKEDFSDDMKKWYITDKERRL